MRECLVLTGHEYIDYYILLNNENQNMFEAKY